MSITRPDPDLLALVRRHADAHADALGLAQTPVAGLHLVRATRPGALQVAIHRPMVALMLQGRKRVGMGAGSVEFGAGESLLITADVPTVSQIITASRAQPYYSLAMDLDPVLLTGLAAEMAARPEPALAPVRVEPTDADVADAALRLMRLLDRPAALALLAAGLRREMHYWLLAGRHGPAIRALGAADGHAQRIGRAIALIRRDLSMPLRIATLAREAGMSASSFHQHFRAVTTLSPLQFHKQLRLIEARRRMLAEGQGIGAAAHGVGYESVPHFTRDYGRLFGAPPARELREAVATGA